MPYLVPSDSEVGEVVEEVPLARRPSKRALAGGKIWFSSNQFGHSYFCFLGSGALRFHY